MSIEALLAVAYDPPPDGARNVSARDVLRVLTALAEHANPEGHGARPSQETLAQLLGFDRRTVRNALDALELQDRIRCTGKAVPRRHGTVYSVRLGASWEEDDLDVNSGVDSTPSSEAPVSGVDAPPETQAQNPAPECTLAGDSGVHSGGGLGRGTLACSARHKPDPEPLEPEPNSNRRTVASLPARTGWRESWRTLIAEGLVLIGAQPTTPGNLTGLGRMLKAVEQEEGADQARNGLITVLHAVAEGATPAEAIDEYGDEYFGLFEQWLVRVDHADDLWAPFRWEGRQLIPVELGRAPPTERDWFDHGLDEVAPTDWIDEEADDGW